MADNSGDDLHLILERLFLAFCRYRDTRDAEGLARVTAVDCVWERDGKLISGREAIIAGVFALPEASVIRHVMTNILITPTSAITAEGIACYTVYRDDGANGTSLPRRFDGPLRMGDYVSRYALTDDGWRVSYAGARRLFARST
jgi:hypothetical protein